MADQPIIGRTVCQGCGQPLPVRQDKAGRGFYRCNGKFGGVGCGHIATFGHEPTRQMLKEHVAAQNAKAAPEPHKEKPTKSLKEKPAKEAANDDGSDGNGDAGGGVAGKFLKRGRA